MASFRVLFGLVMLVSVLRFVARGWVTELYVKPQFFFHYYGFEWVKPLGATGLFVVFGLMALAALGIALGAFYRTSAITFFLTWTYVELLDVTNYLNHYYFVSLAAFLLVLLPAHRSFSLDVWRRPETRLATVPRWMLGALRLQLGIVYFFAGVAKVNSDWLLRGQPLRIWLASKTHLPLIGGLFKFQATAFVFAWMGCLYDLLVPFFLLMQRTRPYAYAAVIGFHLITWWLFPIGMFPFIMILGTLVFFPGEWHLKWQGKVWSLLQRVLPGVRRREPIEKGAMLPVGNTRRKLLLAALGLHFVVQALLRCGTCSTQRTSFGMSKVSGSVGG